MAYLAVSVEGDARTPEGSPCPVEYLGSTPLRDGSGALKTLAQLRADLVAACQSVREASNRQAPVDLAISGEVTL